MARGISIRQRTWNRPKRRARGRGIGLGVLVALLLVASLASIVFMVAVGVIGSDALRVGGWSLGADLLGSVQAVPWLERMLWALGSLLVGMLTIGMILNQGNGGDPRTASSSRFLLSADDNGFVLIESQSVSVVAEQTARRAPGVMDASVRVRPAGSAVRLWVGLAVHPGADIKSAGESARDRVHQAVERLVGLEVRDVTVEVHVLSPEELGRVLM